MSDTSPDGHGAITEASVSSPPRIQCGFAIEWSVRTDTGLVREQNEDNFVALPEYGVYVVADGMGGHNAGVLASELCCEAVRDYYEGRLRPDDYEDEEERLRDLSPPAQTLSGSMRAANLRIFTRGNSDRRLHGMGTTSVGLRVFAGYIAIAHAGDSRCYLLRNQQFIQVTTDHSLANFLKALNRLEEARMAEANMSNVIMRALGLEPEVVVDAQEFPIASGDRFLLCSDGLSDLVSDAKLRAMFLSGDDRETIADNMLDAALEAGGRDNITLMIVDVLERLPDATDNSSDAGAQTDEVASVDVNGTTLQGMHVPTPEMIRAMRDAQAAYNADLASTDAARAVVDTAEHPSVEDTNIDAISGGTEPVAPTDPTPDATVAPLEEATTEAGGAEVSEAADAAADGAGPDDVGSADVAMNDEDAVDADGSKPPTQH